MAEFKYAEELASVPSCPPGSAKGRQGVFFRFIFDPMDQKSFVPPAIMNPNRKFSANGPECDDFALSMFTSEAEARAVFAKLESKSRNIRKRIGSHLASLEIVPADGVQTAPEEDGHFNLFEYAEVNLVPSAVVVGPL